MCAMDNDHTRQMVKCVVVGDTAVGKTRLICAKACNNYLSLSQTLTTHIPTVWAIDQYRIHPEVLRKSWKNIDGVNVTLRLWDTFGDHEKDRKFAYGNSDVVLLCFSIASRLSLRNCKAKWLPEIRANCPETPIILVGCKNDLRHISRDKGFLQMCRERSPFIRILQECDLITREQGRKVAEEIGVPYYEASVLTEYGVEEVFENAIRVALIARRQQRFWIKSLKNVQNPFYQMPYCPPEPPEPEIESSDSLFCHDINSLLEKGYYADVVFYVGNTKFYAHSYVLAASSSYFRGHFASNSANSKYESTLFNWMSPSSMENLLRFLYTGCLVVKSDINLLHFLEAAQLIKVKELETCIKNILAHEEFMNNEVQRIFHKKLRTNLINICFSRFKTDVVFKVDDDKCFAHRSLLMARSDVMAAMFSGDFKESSAKEVDFPGVTRKCFEHFLSYLYSDRLPKSFTLANVIPLLELANRLCLVHLTAVVEKFAVNYMQELIKKGTDISEHICNFLEPCQVHNAYQLEEYCLYHISIRYRELSSRSPCPLRYLHPENQAHLNKNRWPPASYFKELEYYEACIRLQQTSKKPVRFLKLKKASQKLNACFPFLQRNPVLLK